MLNHSTRCAACKSLRRRCPQDCVLAPYFPSNNPQRFANVHKIFGASSITKMIQLVPQHIRGHAAECMSMEASLRVKDPVYGCVGIISQLQQQIIDVQSEIVKTKGLIAFYNAQDQQQEGEMMQMQQEIFDANNEQEDDQQLLYLSPYQQQQQQGFFNLDDHDQPVPPSYEHKSYF